MTERLRVLVGVYFVRGPMGALGWHYLQYAVGLARLGHDVHVIEDSDDYEACCWDPSRGTNDTDPRYGLAYAKRMYDRLGLGDRWAYHDAHRGRWHGPAADRIVDACRDADLFLNISGSNPVRPWLAEIPARAFVDTDPAFRQVRTLTSDADRALAAAHTSFHTYGERIHTPGCAIPDDGLPWRPTRQPVVLDLWRVTPGRRDAPFTTVLKWDSYAVRSHRELRLEMKSRSFAPFIDLPARTGATLEIAVSGEPPVDDLRARGWRVCDPQRLAPDPFAFQAYVRASAGEFTVAKHGYVVTRTGWFSERSAGYLASGRPVVTQDTGFGSVLPTGQGVLTFSDPAEALEALERVRGDYEAHCRAAREIAEEHFDSRRVLGALVDDAIAERAR